MFILAQVLCIIFLISVLIMFIGYWTYADYYTNIKKHHTSMYWGTSIAILILMVYFGFLAYIIKDFNSALTIATGIGGVGVGSSIVMIIGFHVFQVFLKSRKYFGAKRNKI